MRNLSVGIIGMVKRRSARSALVLPSSASWTASRRPSECLPGGDRRRPPPPPFGFRPVRLARFGRAAACLLAAPLALLLLAPETAQAQASVELVSNADQGQLDTASFADDLATSFTTGSHVSGYTLTRVDLLHRAATSRRPTFSVTIQGDSSSSPDGTALGTLTSSSSWSPAMTKFGYAAAGSGIHLDADTTYWVVLDVSSAESLSFARLRVSTDEAPGAAPGWSIGNKTLDRNVDDSGNWNVPPDDTPMELAIHGYAKSPRPPRPPQPPRPPRPAEPIGDQSAPVRTALEIDLSEAFEDPEGRRLEYAAASSDTRIAPVSVDGDVLTLRCIDSGKAEVTVTATNALGLSASQTFVLTVEGLEAVWYLPPAADRLRQGFVRVLNHSDVAGEVTVTATDDAGVQYEPLTLTLDPRQARAFNTDDLETGNPAKGLTGATGPGTGGWRLEIDSQELDVEALAYARTPDGFVTALGATSAVRADGAREVATFNAGRNLAQVSRLRLVNAWTEDAEATVTGVDDTGRSPGEPVRLTVPAGTSCTVDAAQLESGTGLACGLPQEGLGDGSGKWRLTVASEPPLVAMNLLSSSTGHLTSLFAEAAADADAHGVWRVNLFPAASDPHGRQGFVRVVNRSDRAGEVTIDAFDDGDLEYEPLVLALGAGETVHISSDDLELGSPSKGLTGGTGAGTGTWRLELSSDDLEFEAHAYVRHADGLLTGMNALAPEADGVHRIAFFNPGSNTTRVSVLRLVNPGEDDALVHIVGVDDTGYRLGTTVRVVVPGTEAVELTAAELESGESVEPGRIESGALGDGSGKWRLRVEADREVAVMSLLSGAAGHLTNLSHADRWRGYERAPAVPLSPPETVTLQDLGRVFGRLHAVRGRWSAVPGARYKVDLLRDGVRDEDRSLERTSRTTFRWVGLTAGTYTVRACSVNEDRECGAWSAESNAVVID